MSNVDWAVDLYCAGAGTAATAPGTATGTLATVSAQVLCSNRRATALQAQAQEAQTQAQVARCPVLVR